ncbi:radical SAM/SPASM domain-containing protein [Flexibacterium corallicola]|uniref:radical SAM/SPASM domain-containing protein n=1 Tax=Flexibacterium corallicola TaxID=3037259 RepID=UPI00286FA923|nr:radical SAM protein [Pseudovibrio sp. M1P-2-3]
MSGTFLYQINVTRDCNLRCTHCYISSLVKKESGSMTSDAILSIVRGISAHMIDSGNRHAEIHVIGGEPTMLGLPFFQSVIPKIKEILSGNGYTYELCLVSNLLHPEILKIARLFDRINTSWEPHTRFPKPKLEERWRNAIATIRAAKLEFGVTTSITLPVIKEGALEIIKRLYNNEGIKKIHFGFFIPSGDGALNRETVFPQFHETSKFLIDVANWYIENKDKDPDLYINPIDSLLYAIELDQPLDDIVCPIIPGSIDIDWNGNAATCLEAGGAQNAEWSGNVLETSVLEVSKTTSFRRNVVKASRPNKACINCDAYSFCRSGCGVLAKHWNPEVDKDCPGFKGFIDHTRHLFEKGARAKNSSINS